MPDAYFRPSAEWNLKEGQLLKLVTPLCRHSESGDYWHETLFKQLQDDLHMKPTAEDISFFYCNEKNEPQGFIGTYVDDMICAGNSEFEKLSRGTEFKFESENRKYENFTIAKIQFEPTENGNLLHQERHIQRYKELS